MSFTGPCPFVEQPLCSETYQLQPDMAVTSVPFHNHVLQMASTDVTLFESAEEVASKDGIADPA